jgi:hypothetical protein
MLVREAKGRDFRSLTAISDIEGATMAEEVKGSPLD